MNKTTKLAVAAFCAVGVAGVLGGSSFAADGGPEIRLQGNTKTICTYSQGTTSISICDTSKYGSYDKATKTLILGPDLTSDLYIDIKDDIDQLTIKLSSNNVSLKYINYYGELPTSVILDLQSDQKLVINRINGKSVTVKNGNIEAVGLVSSLYDSELIIDGGNINISNGLYCDKLTMNDGTLTSPRINVENDFLINYGLITVNHDVSSGHALSVGGNLTMNGGTVSIVDKMTNRIDGGILTKGNLTINNGSLIVDGFRTGVSPMGKVLFNGGTTILKNSTNQLLWKSEIKDLNDLKSKIVFGKDMGIKEKNIYVFYIPSKPYGAAGIAAGEKNLGITATITKGETYMIHEGWLENGGDIYDWTWFENWAKEEEWTEDVYNKNRGYVSCLLDNSFQIYNLTDYQAYHGLLKDKSKNKTLTADETKKKETCYAQYFKKSDDKKEQEGLIIEGSGEEKKDDKKDDKENGVPGGPEAGLFGENKAFAVAAAVTVAPVLGIAGYLAVAAKKRADRKVSFKKR